MSGGKWWIKRKYSKDNQISFKINCIRRINKTQVHDAHYIDKVMPMYSLIEYTDNYLKTSEILWYVYWDEPLNVNGAIVDFNEDDTATRLFNLKVKLTGVTGNDGTRNIEIMVPFKYLSNFWRIP